MPQKEVDHKHHRQRLKERFLQEGLDHFDPVKILELMLFYAIPQGDTNPLPTGCWTPSALCPAL